MNPKCSHHYRPRRAITWSTRFNYNPAGKKTLRAYSQPVDLTQFDSIQWMTSERDLWPIPLRLCEVRHTPLLTREMERGLSRMDRRSFEAGRLGAAV